LPAASRRPGHGQVIRSPARHLASRGTKILVPTSCTSNPARCGTPTGCPSARCVRPRRTRARTRRAPPLVRSLSPGCWVGRLMVWPPSARFPGQAPRPRHHAQAGHQHSHRQPDRPREVNDQAGSVGLIAAGTVHAAGPGQPDGRDCCAEQGDVPAAKFAADTGAAVPAGHHTTKAGQIAGTRAMADSVRQVLMIERDPADIARDQAPDGRLRRGGGSPCGGYSWTRCTPRSPPPPRPRPEVAGIAWGEGANAGHPGSRCTCRGSVSCGARASSGAAGSRLWSGPADREGRQAPGELAHAA
jgi:hypothetical protein